MSKEAGEPSKKRKISEKTRKSIEKEALNLYGKYFKNADLILERGVDLETCSSKIKELIEFYHWENLVKPRETDINFTIVAEFYAFLSLIPTSEDVRVIEFRKVQVPFTPEVINTFLGIPEVPHDQIYSVIWELDDNKNRKEKSREAQNFINPRATWVGGRFKIGGASAEARMFRQLLSYNILPQTHTSDINWSAACLIYAILTKQPIDIGKIIHKEAHKIAISLAKTGYLPYPGLIHDLCAQAGVLAQPTDFFVEPSLLKIAAKDKETRARPTMSTEGPSAESSFPSQGSYFNDPALVARLDNMDATIRGGMQAMSDNIFRAFERNRQWCDDLRIAVRGQRDLTMAIHEQDEINLDDFDTCQSNPYTMPIWNPLFPTHVPPPASTHSFGTGARSTFAGTAPGSIPISGLTTGFSGMSLQGTTIMTTQMGQPYTGPLQTLASIAAQEISPGPFDPSLFPIPGSSVFPSVPFSTATLPLESSYQMPPDDEFFEDL